MAFIEPMHRNKPNITYLLTYISQRRIKLSRVQLIIHRQDAVWTQYTRSSSILLDKNVIRISQCQRDKLQDFLRVVEGS